MNRLQKKLQRRLVKAMGNWQDPHMDKPLTDSTYVQAVNISEEGNVRIRYQPSRPHCPCCLIDARDARGQPRTPQPALVAERVRRQDVEWKWTG